MTYDQIRDCEHGRLKGRCEICDLQAEVEELKKALAAEREMFAKHRDDKNMDQHLQTPASL